MKNVFKLIIEKLSDRYKLVESDADLGWNRAVYQCVDIVSEIALEYDSNWIPASDQSPDAPGRFLTQNSNDVINVLDYCQGWNCCTNVDGTICHDYEIMDIIAWQPLPKPYTKEVMG